MPQPEQRDEVEMLATMLLIRRFEERASQQYQAQKIGGFCHLYIGQEAVVAGAVAATRPDDYLITAYRDHAHALARGTSADACMAELFGKATGCSRGLGGSMHYFDKENHMYGGHAIVGAHVPLAAGMAFASKYRKEDRVTLCFFGDGAINQGGFHEALNLAGLFKLPVIFICENNFFAMGTSVKRSTSLEHIVDRAEGYDMPGEIVDGMNFREVRDKLSEIIASIRKDPHPAFVEARTYRYRGHSMSDPASYRTKEELEKYRLDDPITRLRAQLTREGKLSNEQFDEMDKRAKEEAMASVRFAEKSARTAARRSLQIHLFERCRGGRVREEAVPFGWHRRQTRARCRHRRPERKRGMREITYRQALNEALAEEIERDPNVFLMGEEVAEYNGAYKVSQGLLDRFGPTRIIDTPISENGFAGLGIGAAMVGLRPIVEFMTFSFSFVAFDQIVNNAPNMLTMSGGQFNVPITFRGPNGPAHQLGATHSHATECLYANVPGLKICTPATPRDAKGLLKTAVRDNNPVLVLECELFYSHKGLVEPEDEELLIPLGEAETKREGSDVTIISYAQTVPMALAAAEKLAEEKINAEVIDLRSIKPLDWPAVFQSVTKTHRVVIAEQDRPFCGIGAEIAYRIQQEIFDELDAPIMRVSQEDVPMPYNERLEKAVLPNTEKIIAAVKKIC